MPFDPSQPFDVVEDQSGFDPSKPYDMVDSPSEAVSGFDPAKPYEVVEDKSDTGDTLRAPTRWERTTAAVENFAPNLFSSNRTVYDKPYGLIPSVLEASKTSPLDLAPNIPEIKTGDDSIESKIEKLPLNIAAGLGDFAMGTARFLTSPQGMATAGVGAIGPVSRRAIAALFALILAKPAAEKLGEASVTKDARTATEGAALALAASGAGIHAGRGESIPVLRPSDVKALDARVDAEKAARAQFSDDETIPQATAEPLQPKEPVTDIFDEVAAEPVATEPEIQKPEKIVAAAIKNESTGEVKSGPMHPLIEGFTEAKASEHGFLTDTGRFVTRDEANKIAGADVAKTEKFQKGLGRWVYPEDWESEAGKHAGDYEFSAKPAEPKVEQSVEPAPAEVAGLKNENLETAFSEQAKGVVDSLYDGMLERMKAGKLPEPFPANKQSKFAVQAKSEFDAGNIKTSEDLKTLANLEPTTPTTLESINRSPRVKLTAPEGATSVRGTDAKGRTSVQPIATIAKGNPFQGADIVKLEAGTIDKTGKFKAMEGDVEVKEIPKSMGGQNPADPGEIAPAQLAQLTQAITKLSEESPTTEPSKAFDIGEAMAGVKNSASSALSGLRAAGQYLARKFEGKPVVNQMKDVVGNRHLALSESVHNARKFTERALKEVPDKELQEAISNWVDTGGDEAKLGAAAAESKGKYKAGYERALRLTPEQKLFAENLKNYFDARLEEAQKAGILEDGIENYIHRIYEADSGFKRGVLAELGSGLFTGKPALAKQRVFEYDFEAEQAGLKPIKSFVKRVAAYDLALNKAIADRAAVKAMMEIRMPDGRPAIDVAGLGTKTIPDAEGASATLINPKWKPTDPETPKKFRGDYRAIDAPALRKWKWVSADEKGNPTFVQGDVLVHPDAYKQVNALVGRSAIRSNQIGRAALNVGSTVKQTMLDLSLFHPVQIAVHGFEHRSFFPAKEIDFTNPDVRGLIKGGMVVGETSGRAMFDEGLAGSSLTKHIPGIGPKVVALKDWIFQSYIPRLKVSTGLMALERNRARFPNLSDAEVNHLTANQMNRAFGELNYEMMARNKTAQDVFRLTALAPDFLEARAGFVAQALTKYGREQTSALLYGAAAMYVLARVMNKLIDGQYHMDLKDAFSVVHNGKAYGLRTVQGDVIHAGTDFMHFLRNRLNPAITRPVLEAVTGRDEFGRKRTAGQQVLDYVGTAIPISVKGAFQGREKTLLESLMNSTGLTMRRATATASIQTKMGEWMTKNKIQRGPGEFIYDPDKDQYRSIRLAAQEGDVAATKTEIEKAVKAGVSRAKIIKHFSDATRQPVTGSRANDLKFYNSLSDDDKKTFNEAKKEKAKVFSIIRQAR